MKVAWKELDYEMKKLFGKASDPRIFDLPKLFVDDTAAYCISSYCISPTAESLKLPPVKHIFAASLICAKQLGIILPLNDENAIAKQYGVKINSIQPIIDCAMRNKNLVRDSLISAILKFATTEYRKLGFEKYTERVGKWAGAALRKVPYPSLSMTAIMLFMRDVIIKEAGYVKIPSYPILEAALLYEKQHLDAHGDLLPKEKMGWDSITPALIMKRFQADQKDVKPIIDWMNSKHNEISDEAFSRD